MMANKSLFSSFKNRLTRADACNEAGGPAYRLSPKHAQAQFAATGCFGGVYYASAESQLAELRALTDQVDDNVFLASLAVYSRERAFMKDMPAALLLALARRDTPVVPPRVRSRRGQWPRAATRCFRCSVPASSAARACRARCSGRSSAG